MNNQSVLIIDDDDDMRLAMQAALEQKNFTVFTAANGQEGLELLEDIPRPCLILLDLMMPVLDGWEFLKIRERTPTLASIPVVAVSAFSDQAKNIKVDGFIKKPIDLVTLPEKLQSFCR